MKLRHQRRIVGSSISGGKKASSNNVFRSKVTAIDYTPDNECLAVATADRIISIYDEGGNLVDKFNTKPRSKSGPKDYLIRSIKFGPDVDNPKLAVGQSDSIVFVYKWSTTTAISSGSDKKFDHHDDNDAETVPSHRFRGKKAICNKFPETKSPVVSVLWPKTMPTQCIYALMEGMVKIGNLRSNKSQVLYSVDSGIVSLTLSTDGNGFLSSHSNGDVYKYTFPSQSGGDRGGSKATCFKLFTHSHIPRLLLWGKSICVGDERLVFTFYNNDGDEEQILQIEEDGDDSKYCGRDYVAAAVDSPGTSIVVGSFDCFTVLSWDRNNQCWGKNVTRSIPNVLSTSAISWKSNGSAFALATSRGIVDVFEKAHRRYIYKNSAYEVNYVSPTDVLLRDMDSPNMSPLLIQSSLGEITKIDIFPEATGEGDLLRYFVGKTSRGALICDVKSQCKSISEIEWNWATSGKERFIFDVPNACIISHAGELSIIEYGKRDLLGTVRTEYHSPHLISLRLDEGVKSIAFLLDTKTICIRDLVSGGQSQVPHNYRLDFLEINDKGSRIIFRDIQKKLYLFDIVLKKKKMLLKNCSYVQWVPGCDALVAEQSLSSLEHRAMGSGVNAILHIWYDVNEPTQVIRRKIDGEVIDIERMGNEIEVLIRHNSGKISTYPLLKQMILFGEALEKDDLSMCVELLENMSDCENQFTMWKQIYRRVIQGASEFGGQLIAERVSIALGNTTQGRYFRRLSKLIASSDVQAKLCLLNKDIIGAENIYLSHNQREELVRLYASLEMLEDVLRWEDKFLDNIDKAKDRRLHIRRLISQEKDDVVGEIIAQDNTVHAIEIFQNTGFLEKAANLIFRHGITHPVKLLEKLARSLSSGRLYKLSGEVYKHIENHDKALEAFTNGRFFEKAISLLRYKGSSNVVRREICEKLGDELISLGRFEKGVQCYVEAKAHPKALEVAMEVPRLFRNAFEISKKLDGREHRSGIEKVAKQLISKKKFKEAIDLLEKINDQAGLVTTYLKLGNLDMADQISGTHFSKGKKDETYKKVVGSLISQGKLILCEMILLSLGDWPSAVNLYRKLNLWDEAIRVAKIAPSTHAIKKVAYAFYCHLGDNYDAQLERLGLLGYAIDFALEQNKFDEAISLSLHKRNDQFIRNIQLKKANFFETQGLHLQAEEIYLNTGNHRQAVDMYLKLCSWDDAKRVAKNYNDKSLQNEVSIKHGNSAATNGEYSLAESIFVSTGNADMAVSMYKNLHLWDDAIRVAKPFFPDECENLVKNKEDRIEQPLTDLGYTNDVIEPSGQIHVISHNPSALIKMGEMKKAFDMLAREGNWDEIWSCLEEHSSDLDVNEYASYTVACLQQLLEDTADEASIILSAISILFDKHAPLPNFRIHCGLYVKIVRGLLSFNDEEEVGYIEQLKKLRHILVKAVNGCPSSQIEEDISCVTNLTMQRLIKAVQYTLMLNICSQHYLHELACKCAISLLRYSTVKMKEEISIVPPDKALYLAGSFCRAVKNEDLAFVFLNSYIDYAEAIEEKDPTHLSIEDEFANTALPIHSTLPESQYISSEEKRGEVRDWLLNVCIDSSIEHSLPMRPVVLSGDLCEGLYSYDRPNCVITGFPLPTTVDGEEFKSDRQMSRKEDYELFTKTVGQNPWPAQTGKVLE